MQLEENLRVQPACIYWGANRVSVSCYDCLDEELVPGED